MTAAKPSQTLVDLFTAFAEGTASATQVAELERLIATDPAMRKQYLACTLIRTALIERTRAAKPTPAKPAPHKPDDEAPSGGRVVGISAAPPQSNTTHWKTAAYALAAILLIAAYSAVVYFHNAAPSDIDPRPSSIEHPPVATLIENTGDLTTPHGYPAEGDDFSAGEYTLDHGTAEFMLTNSVNVKLRGDTRLHMRDDMNAMLALGSAEFVVPSDAKGYTVHLPGGARVVDLGTRFRVSVAPDGQARVVVLSGEVELRRADADPVALTAGSRARVPADPAVELRVTRAPSLLADAALWLDADAIVGVNDGDAVDAWHDGSPNAHAATAAPDRRPMFVRDGIGGRPSVRFNGAQRMTLPTTGELGIDSGDYEIFIVARTVRADGQFLLATGGPRGIHHFEMHINHPWFPVGFNFLPVTGVHLKAGTKQQYVNEPKVFSVRVVDDVAHVAIDRDDAASAPAIGPRPDAALLLGMRGDGSYPMFGDVAEVLIFDTALTNDQRTQVLEYLQTKYGLATQADHPSHLGDVK